MLLVHAIHIEVTEACHLRAQALFHALAQDLVEQKFRIAIHIQRAFQFALFAEHFTFAIHGGAGGINEWNAFVLAPIKQIQGVLVVVFHHVQAVVVHGVGTRTLVENGIDVFEWQLVIAHQVDEFQFVHVMDDFGIDQIAEFVAAGQIVHRYNVGNAQFVQAQYQVAADKTRSASDDNSHGLSFQSA